MNATDENLQELCRQALNLSSVDAREPIEIVKDWLKNYDIFTGENVKKCNQFLNQ